jgi:S-methylmethionine-dependent homocysteine/selenocysteine methylase
MSRYRNDLPQLYDTFIADGGLETTLVFHEGIDLPAFAAFDLLKDEAGCAILRRYYTSYVELASRRGVGIVLETPTWRANPDWGMRIGYGALALDEANRRAVALLEDIRATHETEATPIVVSGNVGPRGDGYVAGRRMDADAARDYHAAQIDVFADSAADMVTAMTLNYVDEAVGIVAAARDHAMPVAISFTVETDGRLPSREGLAEAIQRCDEATDGYAVYYMINCAHPEHFAHVLDGHPLLAARLRGVRANASRCSHAELDESTELDAGNPEELGRQYGDLRRRLPGLTVFGGCCGTDHRHIDAIARQLVNPALVA